MQPLSSVACALGLLLAVSPATGAPRTAPAKDLADYVNPLGGTGFVVLRPGDLP
jgi:hypothetical protein